MNASSKIIGTFEKVNFPAFGEAGYVTAKIDTGAYSGALHCTKISEVDGEQGKVLRFSPFDHPEVIIIAEEFIVKHVKSSNGHRDKRYFIDTEIIIQGHKYPIILSLADRSEMRSSVLIGRRFLRKNNFLVDVSKRP
ncbi:MAG: ATP-dependent zinc protease [Candidatus Saccharimonadales bacterium]